MKSNYLLIVILICATLFSSCESLIEKWFGKNEELSFTKTDYIGDELRIDGYYYCKHEEGNVIYSIYFFYRNGLVLDGGNPSQDELQASENEFENGQYIEYVRKNASFWGLFKVDNETVQFEMLYYGPFEAYINIGEIINDSTFVITKRKSSYGTKEIIMDNTYHFKPFSPKPDSTNIYIK